MKPASAQPTASRLAACAALLLLLGGCRDPFLHGSAGALEFSPERVEFDPAFVGGEAVATVELKNNGRSALPLLWDPLEPPFTVDELPDLAPAGAMTLTVRFRPEGTGPFSAVLLGHSGELTVKLTLQGLGNEPPGCGQPVACHEVSFDSALGECVDRVFPDGSACDPHNVCISNASCLDGRCIGAQKGCDDQDACTFDVCDPLRGCEHFAAAPCPGDGKCQTGVCDPGRGCTLAPAADGTVCGPTRTCDTSDVCIGGACVQRDPPDGFVCAPASPCQGEGRCSGSVCERPAPAPLQPLWSHDSMLLAADGGTGTEALHDMVLEPNGALSLMSFFRSVPIVRANTAFAAPLPTRARRCILWNTRLVCADYPYLSQGKVTSVDPATGATIWTFDVTSARPDWVALASPEKLFMARLASMGGDRLAAVFEAYPAGQPQPPECRLFFLVVL
ncbi:MAG: tenascin-X, partial [Myxococcaceae bacterium]